MLSIRSIYPRACDTAPPKNDPATKKAQSAFLKAVASNFVLLQLLFLGLFCYVFGSLFLQTSHTHNLKVVFVDYDGEAVGQAVRHAYDSLKRESFPTLIERPASDLPSTTDLLEQVCRARYWGAFYVTQGASSRLRAALESESTASTYDNMDIMGYIWNEALYSPTVDSAISASLQLLADRSRVSYSAGNGTGNLKSISGSAALSILANPWVLKSVNIQPTTQGSRAIYNTVVIILVLIQEFFYLGTINGLYAQFKLYPRVRPARIILTRTLISIIYTFIGSLCVIGTIFAFRSDWNINGNQFVLSWMVLWLFAHTNFLTLDVFTIWLLPPYIPMALVSWIIFNVTSVLLPFELSPAFYRIGYLFPAHEVYMILTDIWSFGCNPKLSYALPILFGWELIGLTLSALGAFRRRHYAALGDEGQTKELQERICTAVEIEMGRMREIMGNQMKTRLSETGEDPEHSSRSQSPERETYDEEAMRVELTNALEHATTRQLQQGSISHPNCNFGPSFNLPFNYHDKTE